MTKFSKSYKDYNDTKKGKKVAELEIKYALKIDRLYYELKRK